MGRISAASQQAQQNQALLASADEHLGLPPGTMFKQTQSRLVDMLARLLMDQAALQFKPQIPNPRMQGQQQ